jgi:hypothetical protein
MEKPPMVYHTNRTEDVQEAAPSKTANAAPKKTAAQDLANKVQAIVSYFDADSNGMMDADEIKALIHFITNTQNEIHDDHMEVKALVGRTTSDMVKYILAKTDSDFIDECYDKLPKK